MYQLIQLIGGAVARASGPTLSRIGARIGAAANPSAIMAAIKGNPVTAGLVATELWGAASDIVAEIAATSPEVSEALSAVGYKPDAGDGAVRDNLSRYEDEFTILEQASDILGGFSNFITVRNALKCDDAVVALYENVNRTWKRR